MKKNYFFVLFAALFCMAMPTAAQVASVADFYGRWQFTADIDVKNQDYADLLSSSCEVVITKGDNGFPAKMTGFVGSSVALSINEFDAANQTLLFLNPNSPQLWAPLHMADVDGTYPYGTQEANWKDSYGSILFTYDAATGVLSFPDFTVVTADHSAGTTEIMAKVSNIKMTLIEAEKIEIPEIAGEWTYTPYYWRNDSTFIKEFKMTLVAKDDTNTQWDATFSFEGFDEFTLPGTFDGVNLDIPFDNLYLDADKKIRFGIGATSAAPDNVFVKSGKFSFAYSSKTLMYQNDYIYIRQEGVEVDEESNTETAVAPLVQMLYGGWIERVDPNAYEWEGTYNVNVFELEDLDENDGIDFPKDFEMVVEKVQGTYSIKKFLGYETVSMALTPSEDGKSATIDLSNAYYYLSYVGEEDGDYVYHVITDANGEATTLTIQLGEDGSLSFSDFTVSKKLYYANSYEPLAIMSGISATKAAVEEAPKFDWVGDYTLTTGQFEKYYQGDDVEFPETFDVSIAYFDGSVHGMDSYYYISTFMNKNIGSTPIKLAIAEDGLSADMEVGGMCGAIVGGMTYYKIYDMNATATPITITVNEDGTISIPSFFIKVLNYNDNTEVAGAFYQDVVLTRKPFGVKSATPADGASVKPVSYIQLIFNEDAIVTMPEGGIEVKNTTTNEVFATSLYEDEYMDKNMVVLQFDKDVLLTPGAYTYTIPAGMVKSVDGEEFAEQTFTFTVVEAFDFVNVTPANGEVEKLETLSFTFNKAVATVDLTKFALWFDYSTPIPLEDKLTATISDDKKTVTVEFESPITAYGLYDLPISAGAFVSEDGVESESKYMWFEIVDYTPSFVTSLNDGDRVQELSILQIGFKNVTEVKLAEPTEDNQVVVYPPTGSESTGTATLADGIITVTFDKEFTEEGDYYFTIPAGMFTMDGVPNEERTLTVELYTFTVTPLEIVSVTNVEDENGHIVAIRVAYNQEVALAFDEYYQTISGNISLMDDKGNAINLVEYYNPSLPLTTFEYVLGAYDENWNVVTTPLTEAGTYTLDLSQIVVRYSYNPDTWEYSADGYCEGTHTITVEATGIERAEAATENAVIYDLLGRRVEKITGVGIYIVNGRKVVIK